MEGVEDIVALQPGTGDLGNDVHLMEFQSMKSQEPGHAFEALHARRQKLNTVDRQEISDIAARPKLDWEVWSAVRQKVTPAHGADLLAETQMYFYDPCAPASEIMNVMELTKVKKFFEKIKENLRWQFLLLFFLSIGGGTLVELLHTQGYLQEITASQITFVILLAGLLMKLVVLLEEMNSRSKFTHAELVRVRMSTTTGNVVKLLMQIQDRGAKGWGGAGGSIVGVGRKTGSSRPIWLVPRRG